MVMQSIVVKVSLEVIWLNEEFVERFLKLEGKKEQTYSDFYISEDLTIGLLKNPDYSRYISFGKFKLKSPRLKAKYVQVGDMWFNSDLLYRAMRVFRRRKKFEFGAYELDPKEHYIVFAVKEGDDIIAIAPTLAIPPYRRPKDRDIEFKDLVVRANKRIIKEWVVWKRILIGKKEEDEW